jgi:hypothetical protein
MKHSEQMRSGLVLHTNSDVMLIYYDDLLFGCAVYLREKLDLLGIEEHG